MGKSPCSAQRPGRTLALPPDPVRAGRSAHAPRLGSLHEPRPPAPALRRRGAAALGGTPAKRGWSRGADGAQPDRSRGRAAPSQRVERRNLLRPAERAPLCREATGAPPPEHLFNSGSDGD